MLKQPGVPEHGWQLCYHEYGNPYTDPEYGWFARESTGWQERIVINEDTPNRVENTNAFFDAWRAERDSELIKVIVDEISTVLVFGRNRL